MGRDTSFFTWVVKKVGAFLFIGWPLLIWLGLVDNSRFVALTVDHVRRGILLDRPVRVCCAGDSEKRRGQDLDADSETTEGILVPFVLI